jgi:hypothetical protein
VAPVEMDMLRSFAINNRKEINMRWALINLNNLVENIVIWDGTGEIFSGITIVQINEGESCNIGDSYDLNGNPRFISQPEP